MVDIVAPGGDLSADEDDDGRPDGILAESFAPGDPSDDGYWYFAGTSQAAAIVSGAAAVMLAEDLEPSQVRAALQRTAVGVEDYLGGAGAGLLDLGEASDDDHAPEAEAWSAAIVPYLVDAGGGDARPAALVSVFDAEGEPADDVEVMGTIRGEGGGTFSCEVDDGRCAIEGEAVARGEQSWRLSVDAVIEHGFAARPVAAYLTEGAAEVAAMEGALVRVSWPEGEDPELGPLAAADALIDAGSSGSTSPVALLLSAEVVEGDLGGEVVDLSGVGLASLPLGSGTVLSLADLGGVGLASLPLGSGAVLSAQALAVMGVGSEPY